MNYVFDTNKTTHYRFPTHVNNLVMDRADATTSEVFIVVLEPGEAPPMHQHDDTEQIFYIVSGEGRLEIGSDRIPYAVKPGNIVRIPPCTLHRIHCEGKQPLRYVAVDCFTNGRPKDEPTWDAHVKVVCAKQGWKFEDVKKS
ncbi:MAG TPA: cupin domain-containing protein [Planctomycetota bacterium]|nr:cupin domain-containing protein [Planctomycetota bacterium]